jgi:hypothetical protein
VVSFAIAATLGLLVIVMAVPSPHPVAAAPTPVRFGEGVTHSFLISQTVNDAVIASGDLLQVVRGAARTLQSPFRIES